MENQKRKRIIIVLFAVLLPAVMFQLIILGKHAPKIPIDKTTLFDAGGNKVSLTDNKGKVMIVSYFQSWCGDCRREQPELEALQKIVGGEDKLKIFLVSDEDWAKINTVKEATKTNLVFYKSEKGLKEIGIHRFPTTYLLNKNGDVVESKVEGIHWNTKEIQDEILKLNE